MARRCRSSRTARGSRRAMLRCTSAAVADACGGRAVSLAEVLAADIVCIHAGTPLALAAVQLRRGTHVNALAPGHAR